MPATFYTALDFHGDPNIGLYGFATDRYCLLGPESEKAGKLAEILKVPVHRASILHLDLIRILVTGNAHGAVAPNILFERDIAALEHALAHHKAQLLVLDTERALGNLMLLNDKGIVIPPVLRRFRSELERFFGLECAVTTIAKLSPLGSLGIATNRGCLAHPQIADEEAKIVERALGVPLDVGTVNFGSPYPGSGIIANSHGFAAGSSCSGPELGRIAEALGFD
jgi:translation initiation factor 6